MAELKRKIAILWHMHQPFYKNPFTGSMELPWVRLHGLKDYLGMVTLLKDFPAVKATYNLVPSLLVQLEGYLAGERDIFQQLFLKDAATLTVEEVRFLVRHFFSANYKNLIKPFPRYCYLHEKRKRHEHSVSRPGDWSKIFTVDELRDLQVWFSLCHFDEEYKSGDERVKQLIKKDGHFSEADKRVLQQKEMEVLARIIPEYRRFADAGQVEISTTPFYHPILPLLLDPQLGRTANPSLPEYDLHFKWKEDVVYQLESALAYMKKTFGRTPAGIWPSEGSLSREVVEIMDHMGIRWTATDETNLSRSLGIPVQRDSDFIVQNPGMLYKPYVLSRSSGEGNGNTRLFFRDTHLSDLIGFHYRKMPYRKAAADLVDRLKRIPAPAGKDIVVPVILDGENAWEYYPNSGRDFLREFFTRISEDNSLETVTFSEVLDMNIEPGVISDFHAGSWINGNFDIWIGDEEDRRGWKLLNKARSAVQQVKASLSAEQLRQAGEYLAIAQGSDWFWWFGKENYTSDLDIFDSLFRKNLQKVYRVLNREVPGEFYRPVSTHSVARTGSIEIVPPTAPIKPEINGRPGSFFEWQNAGRLEADTHGGAMNIANPLTNILYYGFDGRHLYLRIDTEKPAAEYAAKQYTLDLVIKKKRKQFQLPVIPPVPIDTVHREAGISIKTAVDRIIELALPLALLKVKQGDSFYLQLEWKHAGHHFQSIPAYDFFRLTVPTGKDYAKAWQV
jgi:alpha-amylase/alpha-mannosidase (GH57 family)